MKRKPNASNTLETIYVFSIVIIDLLLKLFPIKKRPLPLKINKLLLIRPDHIGDALMATSMLPLIKHFNKEIKVDILTSRATNPIYENNQLINSVYNYDTFFISREKKIFNKLRRAWGDFFRQRKALRGNAYDVVIVSRQAVGNLLPFARLINAKCIIGYGTLAFKSVWLKSLCDIVVDWTPNQHITKHFLEPLLEIGVVDTNVNLISQLHTSSNDRQGLHSKLAKYSLNRKNYLVVCPGAGTGDKTNSITPKEWAQIILFNKKYTHVIISGIRGDEQLYDDIRYEMGEIDDTLAASINLISFIGLMDLKQLYLLLEDAGCIFCMDSLPAHLASMTVTPTIAFYLYVQEKANITEQVTLWGPINQNRNINVISDKITFLKYIQNIRINGLSVSGNSN